jgi:hypothetical protein
MNITLTDISSLAAAIGVLVAAWQLWHARRQSVTTFEDSLAREYRELAAKLPTKAFFDEDLTEEEYRKHLDHFYRYFDLSNEQAFLHQCGRVRSCTWQFWHDGIASNLKRPAFKYAWSDVCLRCSDFTELRALFPPDTKQKIADSRAV